MFFSHFRLPAELEIVRMKLMIFFIAAILPCLCRCQPRYTIVISEIMADPAPPIGLPDYEWIELHNTGNEPINLRNWRIGDSSPTSGLFPEFILYPGQYVIVCGSAARPAMSAYGQTLVLASFPALDNAGETIALFRADGYVMHAVRYSAGWYGNTLKKEGGWTLEMIDAANPCSGASNWKASVDPKGGTPGALNSVAGHQPDHLPPVPSRAYASDPTRLIIAFNESLDSSSAVIMDSYTGDHGLSFIKAICLSPLFDKVELQASQLLDSQLIYTIRIKDMMDCSQNRMTGTVVIKAGLPSAPQKDQCVINEILFNPRPGGHDYIEIFNRGSSAVDASRLYLSNRNTAGQPASAVRIADSRFNIYPGEYIVVTEDPVTLADIYNVKDPASVFTTPSLPSYPDDKATAILMDPQGIILDEVNYRSDWHHKLIADAEGVSLERLDPSGPSENAGNWHSAASTAGYGTPGYTNSQATSASSAGATISVHQKIFSPDNDGVDDVLSISFNIEIAGFIANVHIYDVSGRQVRHLVRSELAGRNGNWHWNGLDDKQQLLPVGMYIIQTELFHPGGQKKRFRNVIALAKRLN